MFETVRILLLEDTIEDVQLAEREVRKALETIELKHVETREEYIEALGSFDPELIISDYNLPSFNGLEALKIKQKVKPDIPLIIFTGSINEDTAVACMKAGAIDYVIKDHIKRLGQAVVSALEQKNIIYAKRRAEQELIKSEERFHRLAENLPDILYRFQLVPEQKIEYINPAIEKITGYTPQDHYNNSNLFKSVVYPEDEHFLEINVNIATDYFKPIVVRWIKKDGTIIWLEQKNIPVYDGTGKIIAIEGIARDITEKKYDELLKQSIYNIAQAANSTRNLDELYAEVHKTIGTIMFANNFYIALYNKDTNEISFPYFIDQKDIQPQNRKFGKGLTEYVISTGQSLLCNVDCSKNLVNDLKIEKIGSLHSVWLGVPLKFEESVIGEMTVQHYSDEKVYGEKEKNMLEYVSTQIAKAIVYKQAEFLLQENKTQIEAQNIELLELNNNLNQNNAELIIAKEKAQESDNLKTAFIHNLSHEIRTPMNAIVGFSELLEINTHKPEKLQFFAKLIRQRSNDLLLIINELLDIARIETGQLNFKPEQVELNKLFEELFIFFSEHKLQLEKSAITLAVKRTPKSTNSIITTDIVKLKQIFINLIHNSFKFTNQGRVEFGFHSLNNHSITFFVSDTGVGIPEDMKGIIFDRFRKSSDESKYTQDGLGLGLSIVKGLLDLFDGKIWLDSGMNNGTTFYFTIPYQPVSVMKEFEEPINNITYNWSNYTILIVEDDTYNVAFLASLLDTSIKILTATSGNEAISLFISNQTVDLVLMDIKLPDMNGFDVTKEFKKIKPQIPIIAQTAFAAQVDKNKAIAAGCNDFLAKPIYRKGFMELLNKYLV